MEDFGLDHPGSPASAKSAKSTRSTKSSKSSRSFKSSKSTRDEILYRSTKYEESISPRSAKSEYVPRSTGESPVVDMSLLTGKVDKQDENTMEELEAKRDFPRRRSTSSYRPRLVDSLESELKADAAEEEASPRAKYRIRSKSVSSFRSKNENKEDIEPSENEKHLSSASVSSVRSKHSYHSKNYDRDDDDKKSAAHHSYRLKSSASFSSSRSKHSVRSKAQTEVEEEAGGEDKSISNNSYHSRKSSSASLSSRRSKRSYRSKTHDEPTHGGDAENTLPDELSIPLIIQDLENGENEAPCHDRELSYREKSALLAMENDTSENHFVEDGLSECYSFRQLGGQVKGPSSSRLLQKKNTQSKSKAPVTSQALGKHSSATSTADVLQEKQQQITDMDMMSLVNENQELKARLQKERTRRAELDEKTTTLQLEVHQKGQEISQLKSRKDVSASHKEQVYKLEDALEQTNRHLVAVVDENVKLREDFEDERAKRCKAENQVKHLQNKVKKRSEEVVALARSMKAKEETYQRILLEERHLREVAESQLAKACHHINSTEQERDEDFEELEKQNLELRHAVKRMEAFMKQKFAPLGQNPKAGRQGRHNASHETALERKPSMISEITTDYGYDELNLSQEGEI